MKKLITIFYLILFGTSITQGQVSRDAWLLGFGFSYPKLTSTNIAHSGKNFGGFLSIQRNFTEHSGLRLVGNYNYLTGTWGIDQVETTTINSFWLGLDYVYYFSPCESLSPFLVFGLAANNFKPDNPQSPDPNNEFNGFEMQVGFSLGAEASLSEDWRLKSELGIYTVGSSFYDGHWGTDGGGLVGNNTDAFMKLDLGVVWYFSKGEPSKICQLYDGIEMKDMTDYNRIEEIVKRHIPKEVVKEVIVEKEVPSEERIVLMGVNFDFNSAKFKPESYPILFHAAKVMHENPGLNIEIQGHSDNIGTEKNNIKVSQRRADAVRDYLIAKGISSSRITTKGYGSAIPIGDNKNADGRAMNRRIEFKISR